MNQARYEHVKRVFHRAVEMESGQRGEFVAVECGDDRNLRDEVEDLLRQHDSAAGFLEGPLEADSGDGRDPRAAAWRGAGAADGEGLRFASYTVKRTLGRGGMGVVYLAEQDGTQRTVALKVIRAGLATEGTLKRFTFEAQVLGRLNHPGIAQIYEAGTADTGHGLQPYFAMEMVDGAPITQHALAKSMTIPERLGLLAQVCDAIEYAHVKGVIHRDLKPGNILVDKTGQVKVLDFGVARATTPMADSGATSLASRNTETGQFVGTLPYMSPEQIAGDPDDLDTRSDVYALGVVSYELLADKPAFSVDRLPPLEAARVVKETEPARLSSFSKVYRGDIETVVAKAMEKDRGRRYQSAAALAGDIRRYLNDEPVEARPASAWYQVRKFARRNRSIVASLIIAAVALAVGGAAVVAFARRESAAHHLAASRAESEALSRIAAEQAAAVARREQTEAERQRSIATSITEFMLHIFTSALPGIEGRDVTVLEAFTRAEHRMDAGAIPEGDVEVAVRIAIGRTLVSLGHYADAERVLRRGLEIAERTQEPEGQATTDLLADLADSLLSQGRPDQAEPLLTRVLAWRDENLGSGHEDTISARLVLAQAHQAQGQSDAGPLFIQALDDAERHLGLQNRITINGLDNYASYLSSFRRYEEAEPVYRRALDAAMQTLGPEATRTLAILNNLAVLLSETDRSAEACETMRRVVEARRNVLGTEHPRTLNSMYNLGRSQLKAGLYEQAAATFREIVQITSDRPPGKNPVLADSLDHLGRIAQSQKQYDDALELFDRAVEVASRGPPSHLESQLHASLDSVWCLMEAGRLQEAQDRLSLLQERATRENIKIETFCQALESARAALADKAQPGHDPDPRSPSNQND